MDERHYFEIFNTPYCDKVICPCRYEGIIKKALTDFKFWDRPSLYRALAYIIYGKLTEFAVVEDIDIVAAVPLSRNRYRSRGYNQSELLASYIAREIKTVNASSVIKRNKDTKKQASLNKDERILNVHNAFAVIDSNYVVNKKVLILDDIFTTGSTISECAKAFKDAGAVKVYAAVVASGRNF
jgi:Predicted amidophosphoribosyltransferases